MRILIADDEPRIRQLLRFFLAELPDVEIVGEATNGRDVLQLIERLCPDIVITDIRMPVLDGLQVMAQTREKGLMTHFIVISGYSDFEYAKTAIRYGVGDYLLKPIDKDELYGAISKIAEGDRRGSRPHLSALQPDSLAEALLRDTAGEMTEERLCSLFQTRELSPLFLAALVKVDGQGLGKDSGALPILQKKIYTIIKNRIRQLPDIHYDLCILDRRCCVILNVEQGAYESIKKMFRRVVIAIHSLPELSGSASVTAALGKPFFSPEQLPLSFSTASLALDDRLMRSASFQVIEGMRDHTLLSASDFVSTSLQMKLGKAVELRNWDEALTLIRDAARQVLDSPNCTGRLVLDVSNELVYLIDSKISACLPVSESRALWERSLERIDMCGSAEGLFDEVCAILRSYADSVDDHMKNKASRPIQLACQYICQNYAQQITLEDAARAAGLSPAYFSSVFKRELNQSYVEYLTGARISVAQSLLIDSTKKADEIGQLVGYQDPKWFAKVFKKATGLSPLEYRKLYG